MILSLLFSVSLGRLTIPSRPRLALTLSGNSPLCSLHDYSAYTLSVCPCPMVSLQSPCQCLTSMSASFAKSTLWKESTFSSTAGVSLSPNQSHKPDYIDSTGGVGRAGLTASAWAIKMGFVSAHPSLQMVADASKDHNQSLPAELEHQVVMSMVERVIAMIRCRRGLKAIESFEQVHFLATYVAWLRHNAVKQ